MKKIIINYDDSVTEQEAFDYTLSVISGGRISEARGIKHYCWVTRFKLGNREEMVVAVKDKYKQNSTDSFVVYKYKI